MNKYLKDIFDACKYELKNYVFPMLKEYWKEHEENVYRYVLLPLSLNLSIFEIMMYVREHLNGLGALILYSLSGYLLPKFNRALFSKRFSLTPNIKSAIVLANLLAFSFTPLGLNRLMEDIRRLDRNSSVKVIVEQELGEKRGEQKSHNDKSNDKENYTILGSGKPFYARVAVKELENDYRKNGATHEYFDNAARQLWELKLKKFRNKVVEENYESIVEFYFGENHKHTYMDVDEFLRFIDKEMGKVKESLDYERLGNLMSLDDKRMKLLKKTLLAIKPEHLLANAMTEIFPYSNGQYNLNLLQWILKRGGMEFLFIIPSLFDNKMSYTLFQLTEYAVYDDGREVRGASIINKALNSNHIPGSVSLLREGEVIRAAYMFYIYNLAVLFRTLSEEQINRVDNNFKRFLLGIPVFISVSHHHPTIARNAAKQWISEGFVKPFTYYYHGTPGNNGDYAIKTRENLKVLGIRVEDYKDDRIRIGNRIFRCSDFEKRQNKVVFRVRRGDTMWSIKEAAQRCFRDKFMAKAQRVIRPNQEVVLFSKN